MGERFVTLDKTDERYQSYLRGYFSKESRALPVRNFNTGTEKEEVTFRIVPVEKLERPPWIVVWWRTLRLYNVAFVLFPLLLASSLADSAGVGYSGELVLLLALSVGCFQVGGNLFNDFYDHITGVDRLHPQAGSRSIQKGWLAAIDVFRAAVFFLSLGAALGVLVLLPNPPLLLLFAVFGTLAFFAFYGGAKSLRYRGGSEWLVLLLLGPFLVEAFYFALTQSFSRPALVLGFCFGWWMLFYAHVKNFEHILALSQAGVRNWVTRLGFEKTKRLLMFWIFGFFLLFSLAYYKQNQFFVLGLTMAGGIPLAAPVFRELKELDSCVGSGLRKLRTKALTLFWMVLLSWGLSMSLFGLGY